jgi:hypothetical protein
MLRLLLTFLICSYTHFGAELSLRGARGVTNVWLGKTQLTRFKNPHHIYDISISPSRKYALVSHMDFRPTKIMTIDISTRKVLADFAPGLGGEIDWTAEDRVMIRAGCGASCMVAAIFDTAGKKTFDMEYLEHANVRFGEACHIEMHPSRRALLFMPIEAYAPGSIVLLRTSDNAISVVGPTNMWCLDWKIKEDAFEVSVTTNRTNYEPTGKLLVRLPKEWEVQQSSGKR